MKQTKNIKDENETVHVANAIKTNYPGIYYAKIMIFTVMALAFAWLSIEN